MLFLWTNYGSLTDGRRKIFKAKRAKGKNESVKRVSLK